MLQHDKIHTFMSISSPRWQSHHSDSSLGHIEKSSFSHYISNKQSATFAVLPDFHRRYLVQLRMSAQFPLNQSSVTQSRLQSGQCHLLLRFLLLPQTGLELQNKDRSLTFHLTLSFIFETTRFLNLEIRLFEEMVKATCTITLSPSKNDHHVSNDQ